MKIGIDISALTLRRTGVGNYSLSVLESLLSLDKKNRYTLFAFVFSGESLIKESSLVKFPNAEVKIYRTHRGLLRRFWHFIPFISADFFYRGVDFLHLSDIFYLPTRNIPTLATIYDLTPSLFPHYHYARNIKFHDRRNKFIAKHSKLVITLSQNSKKDINSVIGIPPGKIRVVPGAISDKYRPIENRTIIKKVLKKYHLKDGQYFLFIGTIEPRKNIEGLLEAYGKIRSQLKSPFKVVLVGEKAWGWKNIQKSIHRLNLKKDTLVTGYIPDNDLVPIINGAKAFIYPSFYEGFGLPVLETMACGIPVIGSNTSSLPEVIGDGGLMVNPKDYTKLASYMLRITRDVKLHAELSRKALERAKLFSWKKSAQMTLQVYNEMEEFI
mgnify:CR=1 FL=1